LTVCGTAAINFLNQTGSGAPLRDVFTANPEYEYTNYRAGILLSFDRLFFPDPEETGEGGNSP
jgi:hypothetical protein